MSLYLMYRVTVDTELFYGLFDDSIDKFTLCLGISALHICADRQIVNAKVENSVIKLLSNKWSKIPVLTEKESLDGDKLYLVLPSTNGLYKVINSRGIVYIMCENSIRKFIPDKYLLNARFINGKIVFDTLGHYTTALSRSYDLIHNLG